MDLSNDEHSAAMAVFALNGDASNLTKRPRGGSEDQDSPDAAGGAGLKRSRDHPDENVEEPAAPDQLPQVEEPVAAPAENPAPDSSIGKDLKDHPFFHYKDHSTTPDADPLSPLTPPGRVPNFLAKMHSILSRPELADVICWLPHGRAWRILKPREFEVKVIPTYFEHTKFSSFIRQANGWGFRRVSKGWDRNAYYHELFLRGLPHLCKVMKRPGVSKKQQLGAEHEPDFYKISEKLPVPDKAKDDSIFLRCTIEGGPKARMPIYSPYTSSGSSSFKLAVLPTVASSVTAGKYSANTSNPSNSSGLTPTDHKSLASFQQSLGTFENQLENLQLNRAATPPSPAATLPSPSTFAASAQLLPMPPTPQPGISALAAANKLAFAGTPTSSPPSTAQMNLNMAAAFHANTAASQFAAGFAAATALSQQQFQTMMGSFMAASNQAASPTAQNTILPLPSLAPAASKPSTN